MAAWEHLSESNEHFTPEYIIEAAREALGGVIELDPASCAEANERVKAKKFYGAGQDFHSASWRCNTMLLNPPGGLCDRDGHRVIRKSGETPPCTITGACGLPPGHFHPEVVSSAKRWWFRLAQEFRRRNVESAVFVGFSLEMLQTMQVETPHDVSVYPSSLPLPPVLLPTPLDFPLCFPRSRIAYDKFSEGEIKKGASPPHASFIAFLSRSREADTRFRRAFASIGKVVG